MPTVTTKFTELQEYNGKDAINTLRLVPILKDQLDNRTWRTYTMLKDLQAPALKMMQEGFLVNHNVRSEQMDQLSAEMAKLQWNLNYISHGLINKDFNPGSWQQVQHLLIDCLGAKPVMGKGKDRDKITTNREALETMAARDELIRPIIDHIIEYRERAKLLGFLKTPLDKDGRIRCNFNITGTNTFRWSSSENAFFTGTNLQNVTEGIRKMFISDPGWKYLNVDLSTGDSRMVALDHYQRLGDSRLLDACIQGDLHTAVAKMVWPDLGWTGDPVRDLAIAEQLFYRHYSFRFMCKKFGHGTNYLGTVATLAAQTRCPRHLVEIFQPLYYAAFGIDEWQANVIEELQLTKELTNIFGYPRAFHGRPGDRRTWREAVAFLGQSGTACAINTAILRVFFEVPEVRLVAQVHDSLTVMYREDREMIDVPRVLACFQNPIRVMHKGVPREHTVPIDAAVGWNWGKVPDQKDIDSGKAEPNPDGLDKWKSQPDARKKRRYDPAASFMDRVLS